MDKSAAYLAAEFKKYGLQEGSNKGFLNAYEQTVNQRPTKRNVLSFSMPGGKSLSLTVGEDFMPLNGSLPLEMVRGDVVFVGFGIQEEGWDDYAGVDVKGKIALILRGAPGDKRPLSNAAKARKAKENGAAGVVLIGPSGPNRSEIPRTNAAQGVRGVDVVAVGMHRKWFKDLTGMAYEDAMKMAKPASKPLEVSGKIITEMEPNKGNALNVIGYLPGRDPILKNEFIIVGAHYDHLGYGETGSRTNSDAIHRGADDNGSGTVGLLALAKYYAKQKNNKRTIIFQLYSGEELGLRGSGAWADANADTLKSTSAMINMDMIGRVRDEQLYIYGTSSCVLWDDMLKGISIPGLKLVTAPNVRGDSDQASFARKNVPVLFFHTGLHDEYHTEKDDLTIVNFGGMSQVLEAVSQTINQIDRHPALLEFNKEAQMGNRPTDRQVPSGGPRRVLVGFVPDMMAGGPGLRIAGTTPGSPAEKAGFKSGDVITSLNGKPIADLESYTELLKGLAPGDKVKIGFTRDGKPMEVEFAVVARPGG